MANKIDSALADQLEAELAKGITKNGMEHLSKTVNDIIYQIEDDIMYRLKDALAPELMRWVVDMAENAVEQLLAGNEDQMRRYLSCDKRGPDGQYICYTGRSDGAYGRGGPADFHHVIHRRLFEQGALGLRKKIAQANEAIIKDERIRDLEDQVASLVIQVNKAVAEKERMWERLRDARIDA